MSFIEEGTLLWKPSAPWLERANIETYVKELEKRTNEQFPDYASLWQWSVTEIEQFWESIWDYFDVTSTTPYDAVLTSRTMPGAKWFTNAHINYTEHIFKQKNNDDPAIIHCTETRQLAEVSWEKLYNDTAQMQHTLKELGVQKGDRVVAYVANTYESVVAFLATASLGAIWSSASPDFGTQSVIDRFSQIEPKVMFTIDGYTYGGKPFDRTDVVSAIQKKLPTLEATIVIPYLQKKPDTSKLMEPIMWEDATSRTNNPILTYEYVEFNEPLWILFSSGTTGRPKPIVQSQGGILLEHYKAISFHVDLHRGDRFFWYTTTGWMMWNFLVGGLLAGSTIILYDGNPQYPHAEFLWELAERTKMNIFGTSASYITHTMKSGISPKETYDLQHLRSISSTGSPLPPEGFAWCYEHVKKDLWIASISGGTDVCTAFILGVPTLPVYAGELQCRGLGAKVESFSDDGRAVIDEVGELVLTEPLPSMPIYFWDDEDGSRLHDSYFDMFPNIWRHGDYIKITNRGTCIIYGRSDATINRGGIRIGTSEIYRAVDHVDAVVDSLIVEIPDEDDSIVLLFVVLQQNEQLSDEMKQSIRAEIREHCSPRHIPTHMYAVDDLPKTLNGKKLEIPIKRILMGHAVADVVNKDSLQNPDALDYFIQFAETLSK